MSKILIWDIETIGMPNGLKADVSSIICIGYKWLGEKKTHILRINDYPTFASAPMNDKQLIKDFVEIYKQADATVAHFGSVFDRRFLEGRLVINDLPPLPDTKLIDTCMIARSKFAFRSNSLRNLAIAFGCEEQKGESNFPYDWINVLRGGKIADKAMKDIGEYCKQDVRTLEEIYMKIRARISQHPHVGVINGGDKKCSCRVCGSEKLKRNGIRIMATGVKKQEVQCLDCGAYTRFTLLKSDEAKG